PRAQDITVRSTSRTDAAPIFPPPRRPSAAASIPDPDTDHAEEHEEFAVIGIHGCSPLTYPDLWTVAPPPIPAPLRAPTARITAPAATDEGTGDPATVQAHGLSELAQTLPTSASIPPAAHRTCRSTRAGTRSAFR